MLGLRHRAGRRGLLKPPSGTPLNWQNLLTQGLAAEFLMNEGGGPLVYNAAEPGLVTAASGGGPVWKTDDRGPVAVINGTTQAWTQPAPLAIKGNRWTVEARIKFASLTSNSMWIFEFQTGVDQTGNEQWWFGLDNDPWVTAVPALVFGYYTGGASWATPLWAVGSVLDTTNYHTVAGSYDGANARFWVDGILRATVPSAVAPVTSTAAGQLNLCQRPPGTSVPSYLSGAVSHIRMWNRALVDAEIRSLYQEPYQFYQQPALRRYFDIWQPTPRPTLPAMALPGARASGGTAKTRLYYRWQRNPRPTLPPMGLPGANLSGEKTIRHRYYERFTIPSPYVPVPAGTECWAPVTERLKGYLAAPFTHTIGSKLDRFMSSVARELSSCTESVTLVHNTDARGTGSFTFQVRFEPITSVFGVQRVDANGAVLENYSVNAWDTRSITVTGLQVPRPGDLLNVTYTYRHEGLEKRVQEALAELNILTATGDFLDAWGTWFNTPRLKAAKYGQSCYGSRRYGGTALESDSSYSRRIIDRVTQPRNTKPGILAAVRRLTGGAPYIVEWTAPGFGWVFRATGATPWAGDSSLGNHLIWGKTARFVNPATGAGACIFEVWVPSGSGYSTSQILTVVKQYKASGTKAFVRYYS